MAHAATAAVRDPDSWLRETGLLQLKSRPVPMRAGHVPRERLLRQLMGARDVPVALIVAPAGYGKTALLAEWAACDGRPFAWVTLDPEDDDPRTLLSAIALAVDQIEPVSWDVFEALASDPSDGVPVALKRLARSLRQREVPLVLALDDVHLLRSPESRDVLTAIWQAAGAGLQVAMASRTDALLPVARLRALGNSVELRAEDLAMTRSEAAALLRLAGVELESEQVLALSRTTEGWPTGLFLAALSLREQTRCASPARAFSGDDRFVSDYVKEEFLSGLPGEELDFLTRSSVLDRLSAQACDAVLDRHDSAEVLARLERSNALIVPLDRRAGTYRYHELFASVLRAELHRRKPGHSAGLHRRASAWWARQRDMQRAIDHSIDAGDTGRAAELLWQSALVHAARAEQRVIWSRLNRFLDQELADTSLLALVAAGTALLEGDLYEAERWSCLARSVPHNTDLELGGLAMIRAGLARRGLETMGADAEGALELLGERSPWRPLCVFLRGVALHLEGDGREGRDLLEEGAHLAAVSAPLVQALALSQLALVLAHDGDAERATVMAGRGRAQVERCRMADSPLAALVFVVSAELRARGDQIAEATVDLRHALRLLGRITDPSGWYAAECHIVAARASLRVGDRVAAAQHSEDARRALRGAPDAPVLLEWLKEVVAELEHMRESTDDTAWSLTTAELRVLRHLPSHLSIREIAERLYVSPNTVKTHARGIYRKLGVSGRGEAVERARAAGLVEGGAAAYAAARPRPSRADAPVG